ncbi:MAG: hypothetical protein RLY78_192 [Pseudomonadota bacterium]|jgi:hypothetical protein
MPFLHLLLRRAAPCVAAACVHLGAQAAIAPGSTGNGELFFNVVDSTAKISYVMDLGIEMDTFYISAQQDAGYQRFWTVDSANWTAFLDQVTLGNLQWSVVAIDSTGSTSPGLQRLFTTVRQGAEAQIANTNNKQLSDGIAPTTAGTFFNNVNGLAGHAPQADYTLNGDSYSLDSASGNGYYGTAGGLTPTYNGNAPFNATNTIGKSSWFYYLTRSGSGNLSTNKILVDEFDNLGADGYWGFVKVQSSDPTAVGYAPTSPYLGQYLLSFTMPVYSPVTTSTFREFAQAIDRTAYGGGMAVTVLGAATVQAVHEQAAATSFSVLGGASTEPGALPMLRLLDAPLAVSSVPEPGTGQSLALGALALVLVFWRKSRR